MLWYERLINKPWKGIPDPPRSFNCGELIRYAYKKRLNIELPPIYADGENLRQSILNMSEPELYGFEQVVPREQIRPFDVCILQRNVRRDHVALVVETQIGLMYLHCVNGAGVILESMFEIIMTTGSKFAEHRRHHAVTEELALCHA